MNACEHRLTGAGGAGNTLIARTHLPNHILSCNRPASHMCAFPQPTGLSRHHPASTLMTVADGQCRNKKNICKNPPGPLTRITHKDVSRHHVHHERFANIGASREIRHEPAIRSPDPLVLLDLAQVHALPVLLEHTPPEQRHPWQRSPRGERTQDCMRTHILNTGQQADC